MGKNNLLDVLHGDGVYAAERLIEDQELWLVQHRGDELELLLHTLRKLLALLLGDIGQLDPLEFASPRTNPSTGSCRGAGGTAIPARISS